MHGKRRIDHGAISSASRYSQRTSATSVCSSGSQSQGIKGLAALHIDALLVRDHVQVADTTMRADLVERDLATLQQLDKEGARDVEHIRRVLGDGRFIGECYRKRLGTVGHLAPVTMDVNGRGCPAPDAKGNKKTRI